MSEENLCNQQTNFAKISDSQSQSEQILVAIEKLRQLSQVDIISNWRYSPTDINLSDLSNSSFWENAPTVQLNNKGHVIWAAGKKVLWLAQKLVIPKTLTGYTLKGLSLRLALTWWAEDAQIFVNNQFVQAGDLLDYFTRVLLSNSVTPGEEIMVALRLVSPGHDRGALMRACCVYESGETENLEPGFIADELAVILKHCETFARDKLNILATAISQIDWSVLPNKEKFDASLAVLRETLNSQIPNRQTKISLLGHAHLDMAWLWPVSETWLAAQRTFTSVLNLQKDFPDLIFCHTSPALYAWIETHRPDLFTEIKKQVEAGVWELIGGMWIEPDLNLISGESIVRQILYGQLYFQEKFGQLSKVVWVPDSFGFCATLPQFLKLGGIEYFVTQKLTWNDTTKFPYGAFWWQSPDGTRVFSLMSALIGEGIEPIKMANYAVDWEIKTGVKNALWLPGVGDHGGGPTRDMLETVQRWQKSPFFPQLEFTKSESYLESLREQLQGEPQPIPYSSIPVWQDELYLEFHRGCYTTHADQKRSNRRCEGLLYEAELWASLATLTTGAVYPKLELENAWKQVLFNQFHDILPGTSINQVFVEANQTWQEVERVGGEILENAWRAIASQIAFPPPPKPGALPIVVFNSLNWHRSEVVTVTLPAAETLWQVCDLEGTPLPSQDITAENNQKRLIFVAHDLPSVGYRGFWLCPRQAEMLDLPLVEGENPAESNRTANHTIYIVAKNELVSSNDNFGAKDWVLENEFLRVEVSGETGNLGRVFDKVNQREVLGEAEGNQLQAFQDSGQYWDAWNIAHNYEKNPLPPAELESIEWVEKGEIRQRLRVIRKIGKSEFVQDYVLSVRSPILKISSKIDWQERQVLVKAAFPLNVTAEKATYEIACGAIQRRTKPQEPRETAKWEVPALRWADLTEDEYGVSLLNDCKYGYDSQPNQLRLTLLRSPNWPDPEADKGEHEFTYALYPHKGNWQTAQTVRRGYELNLPLKVMLLNLPKENLNPTLPAVGRLLDLTDENLILMAFKQAEGNSNQWVMRCYECHGETAELKLQSDLVEIVRSIDLLERQIDSPEKSSAGETWKIAPGKIASFECKKAEGNRKGKI
ncbi:alpha-mannosidase [Phormidium sp. LEGE 05292]|uniref:alpha-mannosidase n=1 Tax=[Phormidium] sp. LEGE 05292 TaxID=767427 RepID=UPI00187E6536|nr:alpha-mannosidase [Phormidium sp. LEGE 05292]MBE9226428.1 alpha-mannosidase [Phormidium sp. LEGE 05292]